MNTSKHPKTKNRWAHMVFGAILMAYGVIFLVLVSADVLDERALARVGAIGVAFALMTYGMGLWNRR